jgi:hypothetical protein
LRKDYLPASRKGESDTTNALTWFVERTVEPRKESMPVKPSDTEDEYFVRQEAAKLRKAATERQAKLQQEERERERELHHMKCPKCGMQLEEISFGGVNVDKCFNCEGLWLDNGELERLQTKESGFLGKLLGGLRS